MYRYIWKINLKDSVSEEDFKKHRHDGSMILQEYPGAIGTHIHAARYEARSFFLVAGRESTTARNAMSQDAELGQADGANQWKVFP